MLQLRTETLHKLRDGIFAQTIDQALAEIHEDCVDRPRLKKDRKLDISLKFKPTGEDPLESVDIEFSVKKTIPESKIVRRMQSVKGRNSFGFEADTDSIRPADGQQTLYESPDEGNED